MSHASRFLRAAGMPPAAVRRFVFVFAFALAPAAAAATFDLNTGVPIFVDETHGVARSREPVTFGFPLGEADAITDPAQLVVTDLGGSEVPAQFRVLTRWRGAPADPARAVRWLLVDLQVDVDARGLRIYLMKRRTGREGEAADGGPAGVGLKRRRGAIKIDTGAAQVHLRRKGGDPLSALRVDLDGDGVVERGERLLGRARRAGFILTDRFGAQYSSAEAPSQVVVEEAGPLRVVVRADGRHDPLAPGQGIGRDFFTYRTRYTFYAGKAMVRVQHALRNAYLERPLGSIGFDGYQLVLDLGAAFAGGAAVYGAGSAGGGTVTAAGGASRLYQDSHGGDSWADSPGTSFRGFRVTGDGGATLGAGDQADGFVQLHDGRTGVTLAVRDWFENFPKGLATDGQGRLTLEFFPAEFREFHWLDDGQQKTTDFLLAVSAAGAAQAATVAAAFQRPLRPYAHPDWTRATKAFGDQGDLDRPGYTAAQMAAYDDGRLGSIYGQAFQNSSYSFGWSEFGEMTWARNTHTTGSPRNKLSYFDKFVLSGSPAAFRIAELFALHSRDIRTYHIDGFSREQRPNAVLWEALPVWPHSPDKLHRDQLDPNLAPHRDGIPPKGHGWNAFDFEHFTVDDLFEHYLMTGDWVTLDSLAEVGECVRTWPIYSTTKAPGSTRGVGWTLRGLVQIHQVTGDRRFLDAADALVMAVATSYGRDPSPETGYVYHYVTRYPPHANHIADDEYDLPWQIGVAIHGLLMHQRETGSVLSRRIALDVADYLVDFAWNGVAMDEALDVDDHLCRNPKSDNSGVNTWIPSALALSYRLDPRPEFRARAFWMYDSVPGLTDPLSTNGYGIHHWWHSVRALRLGD